MKELLKELSLAFGPSGCEDEVRDIIEAHLRECMPDGAEIIKDRNGAVILHIKNENAKRLMVSAHMDEVGFMVTSIEENGLLRFGTVGGMDTMILSAKRVISESGHRGSIIVKPVHLLSAEERDARPKVKDMLIDIGASSKEEAEGLTFVGEYFTFDSDYVEYGDGYVKCKALDDRLGCAIMLRAIKHIKDNQIKPRYDLYFAFTCREEVGYSGAYGASQLIRPDYAIVIESKAVADVYKVDNRNKVCVLGEGAIISFADRGTIYDRDFTRYLMELCDKREIKYQTHRVISGGNDSAHIQKTASGCRVGLLSAASRYIHSPSDVVHYDDLENIFKALSAVLEDN